MSVEVTDEIKAKFWEAAAWPGPNDLDVHRGLAAVLEIVKRGPGPHAFQEYNKYGNDCHMPNCRLSQSEH